MINMLFAGWEIKRKTKKDVLKNRLILNFFILAAFSSPVSSQKNDFSGVKCRAKFKVAL